MLNKPAPKPSPTADADARRRQLLNQCAPELHRASVSQVFVKLCRDGLLELPRPGSGRTLLRWRVFADIASYDLVLAKLAESHADALAILEELQPRQPQPANGVWAVWASEANTKLVLRPVGNNQVLLTGLKRWCSAASTVTHALVTAWQADGAGPLLVKIPVKQPGIKLEESTWKAVGMAHTGSVDLHFDGGQGELVGGPRDYLTRPGFWQGGAGVAACWHGGATALAHHLRKAVAVAPEGSATDFRRAALGQIDVALSASAAMLRQTAAWIDQHPFDDASTVALRARRCVEQCATQVLDLVGQALGATPYGHDEQFAHMAANLPVYLRQNGGQRDAVELGSRVASSRTPPWTL